MKRFCVRPGITDLASIKYRDEAAILGCAADPEAEYVERVLPEKIRLAKEYVQRQSLRLDLAIVFGTIVHLVGDRLPRSRSHRPPAIVKTVDNRQRQSVFQWRSLRAPTDLTSPCRRL